MSLRCRQREERRGWAKKLLTMAKNYVNNIYIVDFADYFCQEYRWIFIRQSAAQENHLRRAITRPLMLPSTSFT
jgi:hypothetical protein